jgi:hypothetical protein
MEREIAREEDERRASYYESPRHTMQIDFNAYVAALHREIKAGSRRPKQKGSAV